MSVLPSSGFRKMEIPSKVPRTSCLSCQQMTGLPTPPSSLPSSLPDSSSPDGTWCLESLESHKSSFEKQNWLCKVQHQHQRKVEASKDNAMDDIDQDNTNKDRWLQENTYHHADFALDVLRSTVAAKGLTITVIVPAREVASTIGGQ